MPRTVPEWRGNTDNSKIPDRVKLRVFERDGRVCYICGKEIRPGNGIEFHHRVPLADGGENRETNVVSTHTKCHRKLTTMEAGERSRTREQVKAHYGISRPKRRLRSRNSFAPFVSNTKDIWSDIEDN